MITIKSETVEENGAYRIDTELQFNVETPSQFENESEDIIWTVVQFMEDHSELSKREILLSLLADLDDADGEAPYDYEVTRDYEEVQDYEE